MTLRELKGIINITPNGSIPNAKKLRESGDKIVAHTKKPNVEITVFQSGYAIYCAEGYEVVIRADQCKDYTYHFAEGSQYLPEEYFMDESYEILLALVGEDRLAKNQDRKSSGHGNDVGELDDIAENGSLEDDFINRDSLEQAVKRLTAQQKAIYKLHFVEGYSIRKTGEILGISFQVVGRSVKAIQEKIKKYLQ